MRQICGFSANQTQVYLLSAFWAGVITVYTGSTLIAGGLIAVCHLDQMKVCSQKPKGEVQQILEK